MLISLMNHGRTCALNKLLLAIFMQCALFSLLEQDISYTRLQYTVVYLCTDSGL